MRRGPFLLRQQESIDGPRIILENTVKAPGYSVKNTIKFFRKHGLPEAKDFLDSSLERLWVHFHPKHKYKGDGHEEEPTKKVTPSSKKKRSKVEHAVLAGEGSDHRPI